MPPRARAAWCAPGLTNTPLQALDLMNNTQYVEAARVLAQRMMEEGGATPAARIGFAFRRATARLPRPREEAVLLQAFNEQLASFQAKARRCAEVRERRASTPRDAQLDARSWPRIPASPA